MVTHDEVSEIFENIRRHKRIRNDHWVSLFDYVTDLRGKIAEKNRDIEKLNKTIKSKEAIIRLLEVRLKKYE